MSPSMLLCVFLLTVYRDNHCQTFLNLPITSRGVILLAALCPSSGFCWGSVERLRMGFALGNIVSSQDPLVSGLCS